MSNIRVSKSGTMSAHVNALEGMVGLTVTTKNGKTVKIHNVVKTMLSLRTGLVERNAQRVVDVNTDEVLAEFIVTKQAPYEVPTNWNVSKMFKINGIPHHIVTTHRTQRHITADKVVTLIYLMNATRK